MDASLIAGVVGGIVSAGLLALICVVLYRTRKMGIPVSRGSGMLSPGARTAPAPVVMDVESGSAEKDSRPSTGVGMGSRTMTMESGARLNVGKS